MHTRPSLTIVPPLSLSLFLSVSLSLSLPLSLTLPLEALQFISNFDRDAYLKGQEDAKQVLRKRMMRTGGGGGGRERGASKREREVEGLYEERRLCGMFGM